ncbi:MAG: hypothetical protein PF485_10150 [Bacteroidales bacterium]|jgi:hypothetical protein|nr:hypothetical protein [Bacteroidales bacterium]
MKNKYFLLIGLVLLFGVLPNCKSDKKNVTEEVGFVEEVNLEEALDNVIYVLPSPNEILAEIFIADMNIKPELANSHKNATKYVDTRSQSINLGVYIADFAYLSYSEENTTELDYLKVIKQLSEKVNMYGLVGNSMMDRIRNNLTEKDSLNVISQELYYEISNNLESSNRHNIFTLISSGAIIESMYLSVSTVDNFEDYKEVIKKMYEQKFVFDNFYEYAMVFADDPYVEQILDQLEILKQTFDKLEKTDIEKEVVKNEDQTLRFGSGSEFVVNSDNFKEFKTNIVSIRNEIVAF